MRQKFLPAPPIREHASLWVKSGRGKKQESNAQALAGGSNYLVLIRSVLAEFQMTWCSLAGSDEKEDNDQLIAKISPTGSVRVGQPHHSRKARCSPCASSQRDNGFIAPAAEGISDRKRSSSIEAAPTFNKTIVEQYPAPISIGPQADVVGRKARQISLILDMMPRYVQGGTEPPRMHAFRNTRSGHRQNP